MSWHFRLVLYLHHILTKFLPVRWESAELCRMFIRLSYTLYGEP
jgi:hypothetical protein